MDPNPYESPPPLEKQTTSQRLARLRAPTGPSSQWWGMLALGIGASLLFSCVPGLGVLAALIAAPLLIHAARRDCKHPHRDFDREPLRLAGTIAASVGVAFASAAAFVGVCFPAGFASYAIGIQPIDTPEAGLGGLVILVGVALGALASLAVLYAGYRSIRAARNPYMRPSTLPEPSPAATSPASPPRTMPPTDALP